MKKILLISVFSLSILFFSGVATTSAQVGGGDPPVTVSGKIKNPFKEEIGGSLYQLIKNIVDKIILPVGGVLCVLAFIYAGFLYVTAQGNETQITKANTALLYAAIGTAVLLGSWVLANAICKTIGALGGPVCDFTPTSGPTI